MLRGLIALDILYDNVLIELETVFNAAFVNNCKKGLSNLSNFSEISLVELTDPFLDLALLRGRLDALLDSGHHLFNFLQSLSHGGDRPLIEHTEGKQDFWVYRLFEAGASLVRRIIF